MSNIDVGRRGERSIAEEFFLYGHSVEKSYTGAPFDLLVDGQIRVEVKNRTRNSRGEWHFFFSNRGKRRFCSDIYIARLEGVPGFPSPVNLLFTSDFAGKGIAFTVKSLTTKHGAHIASYLDFRGNVIKNHSRCELHEDAYWFPRRMTRTSVEVPRELWDNLQVSLKIRATQLSSNSKRAFNPSLTAWLEEQAKATIREEMNADQASETVNAYK